MWPPAFQVYELSEVRTALERSRIEGAEAQLRIAHLQAEKSLLATRVIVLEQLLACDLPSEDRMAAQFSRALGESEVRLQLRGVGSFVAQ